MTVKDFMAVSCGDVWLYLTEDFKGSPDVTIHAESVEEDILSERLANADVYLVSPHHDSKTDRDVLKVSIKEKREELNG